MKDQFQWIQDQVLEQHETWVERLPTLGHWEIEHAFIDSYFGDDGEEDFKITACTESRPAYWQAKIKWYLPSAVRHDPEKLEKTLVHELVHVVLSVEQQHIEVRFETSDVVVSSTEQDAITKLLMNDIESATEAVTKALWAAYGPS